MIKIPEVLSLVFAFIAMCVVIYLSYVASKYLAKNSMRSTGAKYINIIDRVALGKDRFMLIIEIGQRHFLVSVTDQKVDNLVELNPEDLQEIPKTPNSPTASMDNFKDMFQKMINKKSKDD